MECLTSMGRCMGRPFPWGNKSDGQKIEGKHFPIGSSFPMMSNGIPWLLGSLMGFWDWEWAKGHAKGTAYAKISSFFVKTSRGVQNGRKGASKAQNTLAACPVRSARSRSAAFKVSFPLWSGWKLNTPLEPVFERVTSTSRFISSQVLVMISYEWSRARFFSNILGTYYPEWPKHGNFHRRKIGILILPVPRNKHSRFSKSVKRKSLGAPFRSLFTPREVCTTRTRFFSICISFCVSFRLPCTCMSQKTQTASVLCAVWCVLRGRVARQKTNRCVMVCELFKNETKILNFEFESNLSGPKQHKKYTLHPFWA